MSLMWGLLRPKVGAWPFLLAVLALTFSASSCSRPVGLRPEDSAQADQREAPFQDSASASDASTENAPASSAKGIKAESAPPFRDAQDLPAGTLITVRLKNDLSSDYTGESLTFGAVVDEPVQVEGNVVLAQGAGVAGRVESTRTSLVKRNRGYIRLTLDAIDFEGRKLPVQTSSLFVHGILTRAANGKSDNPSQAVHLESGRRLTFRLIEPVSFLPIPASGH